MILIYILGILFTCSPLFLLFKQTLEKKDNDNEVDDRTYPPPAVALGLKAQATVTSNTAKDTVQADSFTSSTPAYQGMRSGFLRINGEPFEGTAVEYFETLVKYFNHVLNEEGKSKLENLVTVSEKHPHEHLNHLMLDSVNYLIHKSPFGENLLLINVLKNGVDVVSIHTTCLKDAFKHHISPNSGFGFGELFIGLEDALKRIFPIQS